MISSEGEPDGYLLFSKVIHNVIGNGFDAFIIFTNEPGRSAFNRFERRMAP